MSVVIEPSLLMGPSQPVTARASRSPWLFLLVPRHGGRDVPIVRATTAPTLKEVAGCPDVHRAPGLGRLPDARLDVAGGSRHLDQRYSILALKASCLTFWKVFQSLQAFSHRSARSSREPISRKPSPDAVRRIRSRDLVRQFAKAGPFASIHP